MNRESNQPPRTPDPIRVLIADDSAAFRNAATLLLEQLPRVIVAGTAADGEQALAMVAKTQPDLVLMDLQMPRLNGLLATRMLRAAFPEVRVIIVTLYDSAESELACVAAGASRFIPKLRMRQELPDALAQLFPSRADRAEEARA